METPEMVKNINADIITTATAYAAVCSALRVLQVPRTPATRQARTTLLQQAASLHKKLV